MSFLHVESHSCTSTFPSDPCFGLNLQPTHELTSLCSQQVEIQLNTDGGQLNTDRNTQPEGRSAASLETTSSVFGVYRSICDRWRSTPAGGSRLLLIPQQCFITVWLHNSRVSKRPSPPRRRSAAVGTKSKVLLLLMESDRTVVPPGAHLSRSSPHYFRDVVIAGLINAAYVLCSFKISK